VDLKRLASFDRTLIFDGDDISYFQNTVLLSALMLSLYKVNVSCSWNVYSNHEFQNWIEI